MPSPLLTTVIRLSITFLQQILTLLEQYQLEADLEAQLGDTPTASSTSQPAPTPRTAASVKSRLSSTLSYTTPLFPSEFSDITRPSAPGRAPVFTPRGAEELPQCAHCSRSVYDRDTISCYHHLTRDERHERGIPSHQTPHARHLESRSPKKE